MDTTSLAKERFFHSSRAFLGLLRGENVGKLIVQVNADPTR
jgi:NADPH-dependent curcumin reductase CurA